MEQPIVGYSLPQAFYSDPAVFRRDLEFLRRDMWLLVDHESRIADAGDWFLFELGEDSVIVARAKDGRVKAFHNVCRHRGSRLCATKDGRSSKFTCPYHSWTYDTDGRLVAASSMPEDFDKRDNGLHPVAAEVLDGLIFLNFAQDPPCFEDFAQRLRPLLAVYSLQNTKVAARIAMPNAANWKLVVENFYECYHCQSAHPLLWSIHDPRKMRAFGAGAGSSDGLAEEFESDYQAWLDGERAEGGYVDQFADDIQSPHFQSGGRVPIGRGHKTESWNGEPVSLSLLADGAFDGAQGYAIFNPMGMILLNSDHALAFRFTPRASQMTEIEGFFLVRSDAVEGVDYDVANLTRFWTTTLGEDKTITEENQKGVNSSAYSPGRYSRQEQRLIDMVQWYLVRTGAVQPFGPGGAASDDVC